MKNLNHLILAALISASSNSFAANVFIKEDPGSVRFEQYTGSAGGLAMFRLPSPGVTVFPGTSCPGISVPTAVSEHTSRFIAMYLAARASATQIFYIINTVNCQIVSFGTE